MNDDELLRRLAEAAREEERAERDRLDPRWDGLAAGRLSEEDEAALRRRAEESMEARQALETFSPFGDDFRARVVRAAREQLGPAAAPSPAAAEVDTGWTEAEGQSERPDERLRGDGLAGLRVPDEPAPRGAAPAERAAWTLPRESSRSRPSLWAAAAALAAAVLAVVLWPEAGRAPLPGYQAVLEGALRVERGPGDPGVSEPAWPEATAFAPGNRFELVLRPETAVEGAVEVRTFRQEGDSLVPWPLPAETPEGGAVRIAGTVGREVELPSGESTLVVVIGRRGDLPSPGEVLTRLGESGRAGDDDWQAWRWRLASLPPAEP